MTSVKQFTKRVFGTSKIMTTVAVTLVVVGFAMSVIVVSGWVSKQQKEAAIEQLQTGSDSSAIVGNDSTSSSSSGAGTGGNGSSSAGSSSKTYTAAEVAQHSTQSDCWMIIDTGVYDLTKFLSEHPGGVSSMLPYCGKDGTQGFATKDRGRGDGHSQSASMLKEDYRIGTISN